MSTRYREGPATDSYQLSRGIAAHGGAADDGAMRAQRGALAYLCDSILVFTRDGSTRAVHIGEYDARPAKHVVLDRHRVMHGHVVLDLDVVTEPHVVADKHVLAK